MQQEFDRLKSIIEDIHPDIDRFYDKNNHSAGRRVRRNLQEVKKISQEIRMDILQKSKM